MWEARKGWASRKNEKILGVPTISSKVFSCLLRLSCVTLLTEAVPAGKEIGYHVVTHSKIKKKTFFFSFCGATHNCAAAQVPSTTSCPHNRNVPKRDHKFLQERKKGSQDCSSSPLLGLSKLSVFTP